ncbi:uncharacterized protein EV420DRAFT_1641500 [Desarmillaria tabescens]|uniref:Uncharacterized protein n=1 Tax=Armillaria tabescens TaxID=1929756 RepID=A0AA39N6Y4_ARMTA|nr:uncharacterized protein EV420DRAFT_1641500 [Desarmillaria tabescens]KAK0460172.1 hypothetical protein EV420DRAFT_1641500 [Desarmillaria tabescens]
MPPRRRAPTVRTPSLEDYLQYGKHQKYSSQVLYAHMLTAPSLYKALGAPEGAGQPEPDIYGPGLYINSNSEQIGRDEYIPFLFAQLKDPRFPVFGMHIWDQNWLEARNPPVLINALCSFPNVCVLNLQSIECSEDQFISVVRSYPNLANLDTEEIKIREYESGSSAHADPVEATSVSASVIRDGQRGPEIQQISIYVDNTTGWVFLDLFASRRSPVALRNLTKLTLRHNSDVICNDANLVRRLSCFIRLCPNLWEIDIDHFNIGKSMFTRLEPLDLGDTIHHVHFCLFIAGNFETNMTIDWWASTLSQLRRPRHLTKVTIEVEVDIENIPREVWNKFPTRSAPGWAALDHALTRPHFKAYEIHLQTVESTASRAGFSMSMMSMWLGQVCLPKSKKKYGRKFVG